MDVNNHLTSKLTSLLIEIHNDSCHRSMFSCPCDAMKGLILDFYVPICAQSHAFQVACGKTEGFISQIHFLRECGMIKRWIRDFTLQTVDMNIRYHLKVVLHIKIIRLCLNSLHGLFGKWNRFLKLYIQDLERRG